MAIQDSTITITGRAGSEPREFGPKERSMCSFRLASSRGYYDDNRQWKNLPTTWVTVKTYRTLAQNLLTCLRKGTPLIVVGTLGMEEWADNTGKRQTQIVINASNVGPDLNYGIARLQVPRKEDEAAAGGAQNAGSNAPANGSAPANVAFAQNGAGNALPQGAQIDTSAVQDGQDASQSSEPAQGASAQNHPLQNMPSNGMPPDAEMAEEPTDEFGGGM